MTFLMIPVAAAIIVSSKEVLIARRAQNKHLAGYWEFPGGKVEPNESIEDCLKREIAEELGLTIAVDCFLTENLHQYSDKLILLKGYICTYISGEMTLLDHDKTEWVNIKNLSSVRLAPADLPFIIPITKYING